MASGKLRETLTKLAKRPSLEAESSEKAENEDEDEDERRIEAIEMQVKELGQKIVDFRSSIPVLLGNIVSSASLALLRPKLSLVVTSVASQPTGCESSPHYVIEEPQSELLTTEASERELENLNNVRKKAMSSIDAAPLILKRVNECLARINKTEQNNDVNIPSPFKRRKK